MYRLSKCVKPLKFYPCKNENEISTDWESRFETWNWKKPTTLHTEMYNILFKYKTKYLINGAPYWCDQFKWFNYKRYIKFNQTGILKNLTEKDFEYYDINGYGSVGKTVCVKCYRENKFDHDYLIQDDIEDRKLLYENEYFKKMIDIKNWCEICKRTPLFTLKPCNLDEETDDSDLEDTIDCYEPETNRFSHRFYYNNDKENIDPKLNF
uniref:Uncharacterized protein n=1 Tax=Cryptophlebia leucotreta granulosis virus TaxID=35254 RepID=A0A2H4ZKE4_GVCL|nr:hypothetical protein [Cryptophlebia leucotreta granulovirus]